MADYEDRPWGERRADLRAAHAAFSIVTKRNAKQVKLGDFLLDCDAVEPPSPEDEERKAHAWARAYNARLAARTRPRVMKPKLPRKKG